MTHSMCRVAGVVALVVTLAGAVSAQDIGSIHEFEPGLTIPDGAFSGVSDDIVITNDVAISNVSVMWRVDHADTGSLACNLRHVETGTSVWLVFIIGGDAPGQGVANTGLWIALNDQATTPVDDAGGLDPASSIVGQYSPDAPLAAFAGESTQGTWRLSAFDYETGTVGTFQAWSISFNSPWTDLGLDKPSASGTPHLQATGNLSPGSPVTLTITGTDPGVPGLLFIGLSMLPYPTHFKGGVFGPKPLWIVSLGASSPEGPSLPLSLPALAVPAGLELYAQYWYQDPGAFVSFASTNTVAGVTP